MRSFSSLLLNTYFNDKSTPVVKSLQDIRKHKELQISGNPYYFERIMKDLKIDVDELFVRLNENQDNFQDDSFSSKIAEKVINSKSILIGNTFHRENFLLINKYYHEKLVITNKYYPQIMMFYVNTQLPFSKEVQF